MDMKPKYSFGWLIATIVLLLVPGARGQTQQPSAVREQVTITRSALVLTYPEGQTIAVKLKGTHRLPKANGEAKVERKKGATEIEVELDEMKPAHLFGGDFNTYVLWAISPEGQVNNLGEFILQGNRGKLNVSTRLETFGMFISAEPHYLVQYPSRFLVLENSRPTTQAASEVRTSQIEYRGSVGVYQFDRESLETAPEAKSEVRTELRQARIAIVLAERAQAQQFALEKLTQARVSLQQAEQLVQSRATRATIANMEKAAIRAAYEAQLQAEEGAARAAAEAERKAGEEQEARLREQAQRAEAAKRQAEAEAAQRRQSEEAARRAEGEARRAEEAARRAAEEATRRQQEEARRAAEEAARRQQAEAAAAQSAREAERAGQEREAARARMQKALGMVAETRESARGIIVNLPDILFDFNQATLRPEAREVISRIAGILMVTPGFRLKVEGHTDSVGTDEHNQKLSEKRAQAVKDYLMSANISPELISTEGFGKTQPIADNTTNEGRKKNRRVEIIIEDAGAPEVP